MAQLFNMYKDNASPDIYNEVRASRQEAEGHRKNTMNTAFGSLRKANIGNLQQQYRAGTDRFDGIADPDKKFQVYYDALKALDPQAAQDAAKVYGEERQRRINREVADAYKSGTTGNTELDAITKAIDALTADIATTEANEAQAKLETEQLEIEQGESEDRSVDRIINNTTPEQARAMVSGDDYGMMAGIMDKPFDSTLTPDEGQPASEFQHDWSKLGSVPLPKYDLRRMYDINPAFDVSQARGVPATQSVDIRSQQTPGTGMEDYLPMSRYNGYKPETRTLANMYRGR